MPTPEEIEELALAPKRTRTEEGTVEERSIKELIEANQYQNTPEVSTWGIRVAKARYGSTTE